MVCRCVHVPPPFLAYTMIQLMPRYALMHTELRDVGPDLQAVRLAADVLGSGDIRGHQVRQSRLDVSDPTKRGSDCA